MHAAYIDVFRRNAAYIDVIRRHAAYIDVIRRHEAYIDVFRRHAAYIEVIGVSVCPTWVGRSWGASSLGAPWSAYFLKFYLNAGLRVEAVGVGDHAEADLVVDGILLAGEIRRQAQAGRHVDEGRVHPGVVLHQGRVPHS